MSECYNIDIIESLPLNIISPSPSKINLAIFHKFPSRLFTLVILELAGLARGVLRGSSSPPWFSTLGVVGEGVVGDSLVGVLGDSLVGVLGDSLVGVVGDSWIGSN